MVSIMPGIDIEEPERTDTSSGFSLPPNCLPVFFSRSFMYLRISSQAPFGSSLCSR